MAERIKSSEDAGLEALFGSDPLPDDGFSERVVARIARRLWLRRWLVPASAMLGGLIAVKPASVLLSSAIGTLLRSGSAIAPALQPAPSIAAALVPGALLLAVLLVTLRMLDE